MTIQSLTREIEANRHWFRRVNGRRSSFGLRKGENYKVLSQYEEQALCRIAQRIARLFMFRSFLLAKELNP